jgi:hypothetical protein
MFKRYLDLMSRMFLRFLDVSCHWVMFKRYLDLMSRMFLRFLDVSCHWVMYARQRFPVHCFQDLSAFLLGNVYKISRPDVGSVSEMSRLYVFCDWIEEQELWSLFQRRSNHLELTSYIEKVNSRTKEKLSYWCIWFSLKKDGAQ